MHEEILEDLVNDCPCNASDSCKDHNWCFLKELVLSSGFSDRQALQVRLVYDYKFMTSRAKGYDIGREIAFKEFIAQYASRFAEVYQEGMKRKELFPLVFGVMPMPTDEEIREHLRNEAA